MIQSQTSSDRLVDAAAECNVSLAVAAGCTAIGLGGLVANLISPGSTAVDGLLFIGLFYAALAARRFGAIRAVVNPLRRRTTR